MTTKKRRKPVIMKKGRTVYNVIIGNWNHANVANGYPDDAIELCLFIIV